jgi:hypothetical protein
VQQDFGLLLYKHMHAHTPTLFSLSLSSYSCTDLLIVISCFLSSSSFYGWLTVFDREMNSWSTYTVDKSGCLGDYVGSRWLIFKFDSCLWNLWNHLYATLCEIVYLYYACACTYVLYHKHGFSFSFLYK